MGYAAAYSFIMSMIVALIAVILFKLLRTEQAEQKL